MPSVTTMTSPAIPPPPGTLVSILMGSKNDLETLEPARELLKALGIPHDTRVLSAHRTPDALFAYVAAAEAAGVEVFIAAAGGAAHLPGVVAAKTTRPVLGVPIASSTSAPSSARRSPRSVPEKPRSSSRTRSSSPWTRRAEHPYGTLPPPQCASFPWPTRRIPGQRPPSTTSRGT